jgi:hypothetical protein
MRVDQPHRLTATSFGFLAHRKLSLCVHKIFHTSGSEGFVQLIFSLFEFCAAVS